LQAVVGLHDHIAHVFSVCIQLLPQIVIIFDCRLVNNVRVRLLLLKLFKFYDTVSSCT
jgi:hypothetical protein